MARQGVIVLGLAWALTACGDDGGTPADAPIGGDASSDASRDAGADAPMDAAPGLVSVHVAYGGFDRVGVDVYFQNADSSLVAKVTTDDSGIASATMLPGGFVTAVRPWDDGKEEVSDLLITFGDVKPGDQLDLTNGSLRVVTSIDVTVPTHANATQYMWYSSCGAAVLPSPTATVTHCGTQMDVLVMPLDAGGTPLGWFAYPGLPATTPIVFTDAYAPLSDATITLTNVPASYTLYSVHNNLETSRGPIYGDQPTPTLTGTTAAATFPRPLYPGATSFVRTALTSPTNGGSQTVYDWSAIAASQTSDLANTLLVAQTSPPVYDATARAVTWTAGAGVTPDLIRATVDVTRAAGPSWQWRVMGPYNGPALTFPVLPAEIATYNITASDTVVVSDTTTMKASGGADAARPHMHSYTDIRDFSPGPSGRVVFHDLARP